MDVGEWMDDWISDWMDGWRVEGHSLGVHARTTRPSLPASPPRSPSSRSAWKFEPINGLKVELIEVSH